MRTLSIIVFAFAYFFLSDSPAHAATVSKLSDAACMQMKSHGVLKENSPVPCGRLRIVHFAYLGFAGTIHRDGEIMVLDAAAEYVRGIFEELLRRRFPIARARLMQHYGGDDEASMRDNNTSGFNHRAVTGGALPSLHAYGLAIDINPVQNPYIAFAPDGKAQLSPPGGLPYMNRQPHRLDKPARSGMVEEIVQIFAKHGFMVWGGDWDNPIDYQHFQVDRKLAERLAGLPAAKARAVFERHVQRYRDCLRTAHQARHPSVDSVACRRSS